MEAYVKKLGPYYLLKELGKGAFATVWLADKQTAIATMRVALKLPHDTDVDIKALKREAAIWLQANGHPNVLPIVDADIFEGQIVIASEYAPDGSLAEWLKKHGGKAPSIKAASEMIDGLLAGLAHLHGRHIIHRDLKPQNILLRGQMPLLADFGISRLHLSSSNSLTIGGTPMYMAPEAFNFKRSEQTDIWSVGVIFYRLLSGRLPFYSSELEALKHEIAHNDPPPLPEFIPKTLRRIVRKSLQRKPANRYISAVEMRYDLAEALIALQMSTSIPVDMPPVNLSATTLRRPISPTQDSTLIDPRPITQDPVGPSFERHVSISMRDRYLGAFWVFFGQQPNLPLGVKVSRMFWRLVGFTSICGVGFVLSIARDANEPIADAMLNSHWCYGFIIFWLFTLALMRLIDAGHYIQMPETEYPVSDFYDNDPSDEERSAFRSLAAIVLTLEAIYIVGAYYWGSLLRW